MYTSKIDPKTLSDEHLEQRFKKLERRDGLFCVLCGIAFAGTVVCGLGFSPFVWIFGGVLVTGLAAAQTHQRLSLTPCRKEKEKRAELRKQQAAALAKAPTPLPGTAQDFNPAAATVLENDIRSMAPLRLKKRATEFVPC
jgi:hypothetical protein